MSASDRSRTRDETFTFRARPYERDLIFEAAERSGRWASEMVRDAALRRARRVLRENENDA